MTKVDYLNFIDKIQIDNDKTPELIESFEKIGSMIDDSKKGLTDNNFVTIHLDQNAGLTLSYFIDSFKEYILFNLSFVKGKTNIYESVELKVPLNKWEEMYGEDKVSRITWAFLNLLKSFNVSVDEDQLTIIAEKVEIKFFKQ